MDLRSAVPAQPRYAEVGATEAAIATLPGHPELGEEAFLVTLDVDDRVRMAVLAFSRPARWFTRAAGPAPPALQRVAARRYVRAVRKAAQRTGP